MADFSLPKTILAPMAGYTDAGLRLLAKKYHCGLTVTEMVSICALVYGNDACKELLTSYEPGLKSAQVFGHDVEMFKRAFDKDFFNDYDVIDLNVGCPVKKIVSNGDGSALLDNPSLVGEIVKVIKDLSKKPVSVKMRIGRTDGKNALDFAKAMQDAGAEFLVVHGRTAKQMYSGEVDYDKIVEIAQNVSIPVFANGNVTTKEQFDDLVSKGCHGVAVGRGALGKPYIFAELEEKPFEFDLQQTVFYHFDVLCKYMPEKVAVNEMKKHIACYFKGQRGSKQLINDVNLAKSKECLLQLLEKYFIMN